MAIRKRIQKFGNGKMLLLSNFMLEALGVEGDEEAVLVYEFVGDTMLVRREGAPAPDTLKVLVGLSALEETVVVDRDAETPQRVLLALRAYGPIRAVELAAKLGMTREWASRTLAQLARDGVAVKGPEGYKLTAR